MFRVKIFEYKKSVNDKYLSEKFGSLQIHVYCSFEYAVIQFEIQYPLLTYCGRQDRRRNLWRMEFQQQPFTIRADVKIKYILYINTKPRKFQPVP